MGEPMAANLAREGFAVQSFDLKGNGNCRSIGEAVRGALNNGLSKEEIKEVLMQTAIYCGVPAAVVAFRCAKEVFGAGK